MKKLIGVIPAAGDGTRAVSYTGGISKELLSCVDRPAINFVVAELIEAGVDEIVVVTSERKTDLNQWLTGTDPRIDRWLEAGKSGPVEAFREISSSIPIKLAYQEEPLGLGHAVLCAREAVGDNPLIVVLPDDIVIDLSQNPELESPSQVLAQLGRNGKSGILTMEVGDEDVHKYGIVEQIESNGSLPRATGLLEKPDLAETTSRNGVIGRYVFQPVVFDYLEQEPASVGGEIQLTGALDRLVHHSSQLLVTNLGGHRRFDIGGLEGYADFVVELGIANENGLKPRTVSQAASAFQPLSQGQGIAI